MNAMNAMNATNVNHASPVLFKKRAVWEDISLEHFRFRAGELPEHQQQQHLIAISLSDSCSGEIRTPGGFRARNGARGSVCVIPSGQSLSAKLEKESEHLAIYLEPALVLRAAGESRASGSFEVVEKCVQSDPLMSNIGLALLAELESEAPGGRLYAESLANVLAVHLLRHYTTVESKTQRFQGGLSGRKLRRVMTFITENYEQDLSLSELACVAGLSAFHFAREFKRATGTTPHQHLIKYRVERAKVLLSESEIPLVEVGLQSGFGHQSHFTRLFRKITGTTPQSYRLMFQS